MSKKQYNIGPVVLITELVESQLTGENLKQMIIDINFYDSRNSVCFYASQGDNKITFCGAITRGSAIDEYDLSAKEMISAVASIFNAECSGDKQMAMCEVETEIAADDVDKDLAQEGVTVEPSEDTKKKFEKAEKAILKYLTKIILE